jgi:hypothetical protein
VEIPQSYYDWTINRESGGKSNARNPRSSASGPAQFTDGTWQMLLRQHPELGLSPDGRMDPAQARTGLTAFTNDNANTLEGAGYKDPANLYLAHRFGAAGALKLLQADPNATSAAVLSPAVLGANPDLKNKTVADILASHQFNTGRPNAGQPSVDPEGAEATAGAGPQDLASAMAAMKAGQGGGDPSWMGAAGNGLVGLGAALQSVYNPKGAEALTELAKNSQAMQMAGKPQFGVIGEDMFGKKYGWIDPMKRTVTGADASASGGGATRRWRRHGRGGLPAGLRQRRTR